MGISNRIAVFQEWENSIIANREFLIGALAYDTGRKWETTAEVDWVVHAIDKWCTTANQFYKESPNWIPFQLVTVISPWNFPLALSMMDTLPALLSGSSWLTSGAFIYSRGSCYCFSWRQFRIGCKCNNQGKH